MSPSFGFRVVLSVLLLFSFAGSGFGAELVQVRRELESGQSASQIKQELLQEGFVLGVMKAVNSLLKSPLPPDRQVLLASYLEPRVQRLIISYSDLGLKAGTSSREIVQELELSVNIQAVKKILKKNGLFHTCVKPVRYFFLSGEGVSAEQIRELEIFYGLEQVGTLEGAEAVLTLRPAGSLGFEASLFVGQRELVSGPARFEWVWKDIWEQYFASPSLATKGTSLSNLWVKGWANSAEVYAFDRQLRSWARLVDSARLDSLQLSAHQTQALWSIRSTNAKLLKEKIEQYLAVYPHLQLMYEKPVGKVSGL